MQAKQCVHMCGRGCILVFALQQYTWTVCMSDEHLLLDYTQTEACTVHSMDSFMHEQLYMHRFLPSLRSPSIPHYYCFFWGWCWQTLCTAKLGQRVAAGKWKKKKKKKEGRDREGERRRRRGEEEVMKKLHKSANYRASHSLSLCNSAPWCHSDPQIAGIIASHQTRKVGRLTQYENRWIDW